MQHLLRCIIVIVAVSSSFLFADGATTHVAVIGDYGRAQAPPGYTSTGAAAVANMVKRWKAKIPLDAIITTGDNNYGSNSYPPGSAETIDQNVGQFYHWAMYPYNGSFGLGAPDKVNKFFPSPGNTEWTLSQGLTRYLNYFDALIPASTSGNKRYYDFLKGPVHFFALDSDPREPDGITQDSKQAKWVQRRLATTTAKYRVVYFHHMPYSNDNKNGPSPALRWPFADWGVHVVLSGHAHVYQRIHVADVAYITVGVSGTVPIYGFSSFSNGPIPGTQSLFNGTFGGARIDADDTAMNFSFYSVDGTFYDTCSYSPIIVNTNPPSSQQQQQQQNNNNNVPPAAAPPKNEMGLGVAVGVGTVVILMLVALAVKSLFVPSDGSSNNNSRFTAAASSSSDDASSYIPAEIAMNEA